MGTGPQGGSGNRPSAHGALGRSPGSALEAPRSTDRRGSGNRPSAAGGPGAKPRLLRGCQAVNEFGLPPERGTGPGGAKPHGCQAPSAPGAPPRGRRGPERSRAPDHGHTAAKPPQLPTTARGRHGPWAKPQLHSHQAADVSGNRPTAARAPGEAPAPRPPGRRARAAARRRGRVPGGAPGREGVGGNARLKPASSPASAPPVPPAASPTPGPR